MQKRSRSRQEKQVPEADLIPVLSCMFLLIPALLLAMEVASWASITVSPPMVTSDRDAPPKDVTQPMRFTVMVRSDGFLAKVGKHGTADDAATEIALAGPDHDFAALEALARELKQRHGEETRVNVTAEGDIPFQTLVRTMDALRGRDCSLAAASAQTPDECLFWDVVVES